MSFLSFYVTLLLAFLAFANAEQLTTEKLLELIENIPPEFGYLDTNLYFYLQRQADPSAFPYPEYVTGYEGESVALQITFAETGTELEGVTLSSVESPFQNLQGATWLSDDVVVVPSSELTWSNIIGDEVQLQAQTQAPAVLYITRYFSPEVSTIRADMQSNQTDHNPDEFIDGNGRKLTVIPAGQAQGLFRTQLSQFMAQSGMSGAGVTIGVLSDSVNAVNANTGNTPDLNTLIALGIVRNPVTVIEDFGGGTNEGAAMINIIADMCPGCNILFATAFTGEVGFANNIRGLAAAGAQVIVDDVTYFAEEVFQEGVIEQAVTDVTQAGVLYFSSAGNNGNIASGSRRTYLGQFNPTPLTGAQSQQIFAPGTDGNPLTLTAALTPILVLQWSTPSNTGSPIAIRMGLAVETAAGALIGALFPGAGATRPNIIGQLNNFPPGNYRVRVIVPNGGGAFPAAVVAADRRIFLTMFRANGNAAFNVFNAGATYAHNAPFQGFGVGAANTQLLTTPFTSTTPVEPFSSDGQTPRCFLPTGVYIGCTNKVQPLVTGPDGVTTSVSRFNPFFGTSAAAPAVAAMIAVFRQKFGLFLTPQVLQVVVQTGLATLDIMTPGYDVASGFGIFMAPLLDQALLRQQRLANCIPLSPFLAGYGCNGLDDNCNGQVDECAEDIFPPNIQVSEYALGSKWLTNQVYAVNFFRTNTFVQDDCRSSVGLAVTIEDFVKDCAASTAVVTAADACGNVARDPIMFLYDDAAPVVTLAVATNRVEASKGIKGPALVNVGLAITTTDVCTPNPNVTVRVYSDELHLKDTNSWKIRTVQLSRLEAVPGVVTGWKLLVAAEAFTKCNVGPYACGGVEAQPGNGRFYTIVVCATDEAGLRTCREVTVEVTPKGARATTAVNDGKNYLLAEDEVNKFRTL